MGWTGRTAVLCRGPCGRILNSAKENHDDRGNLAADLQVYHYASVLVVQK